MRALFLYSEMAGYFLAGVKALVREHGVEAHIVHWPVHPDAPFRFPELDGVRFHDREGTTDDDLLALGRRLDPDVVFVSGWMDRGYLQASRRFRAEGRPVVCGLDTWWTGSVRQRVGAAAFGPLLRRCASHAWVPGLPQHEYARRLGFPHERIRTGMYSADVDPFHEARDRNGDVASKATRTLLFVGRLVPVKGVPTLVETFQELASSEAEWRLVLVGNGPLRDRVPTSERVVVRGFVQPGELPQLMASADAFVLPSVQEPWGVALHEAAAAGLPLVASDACGAAEAFVRNGYNGFTYPAGSREGQREALRRLMSASPSDLARMGRRSRELSRQITPGSWAATLFDLMRERG